MAATKFKIYSLLVVKNEADIIAASLRDACRWSDKIIVIDNGSTDGTWKIVNHLCHEFPQIVPFERYEGPFHIGLRARMFEAFRHELTDNDWWCVRLDADEFYPGDVKQWLAQVPRKYRTIRKYSTDYLLSRNDLSKLSGNFEKDRPLFHLAMPTHRRERRFMRNSSRLRWKENWRYPHPWGRVYTESIPVDHYQYRSEKQMELRWQTRKTAKENGCGTFKHENTHGWEAYLYENQPFYAEELFRSAKQILKQGRNEIREKDGIVVKSFAKPRGWKRIMYSFFRKSKARRSYEYALLLGDRTPEPITFQEIRKHHLLGSSYYACRQSACPYTFQDLRRKDFPDRERHLRAIGAFTAQLHADGIWHADYSQGNILFDDQDNIQIVDLNRIHLRKHISVQEGIRNFCRLRLGDDEAYRIMLEAYKQERAIH